MHSPTSTSEQIDGWTRCLKACLGTFVIGALLLFAVMIAIDPYDTGKFGWFGIDGTGDRISHTAAASRARDLQFDSAIIGNSTAQMLEPTDLSRATGLRFVQLFMIGAVPREQFAVLEAFLRSHPEPRALVFVTDPSWCVHQRVELPNDSFPYWLYDTSRLAYAARLLSFPAIERVAQRISIGLGWRKRNDPTGYYSYEDIWLPGIFREKDLPRDPAPVDSAAVRETFPEIALLDAAIKRLPASVSIVVAVPPTLSTVVAKPGTPAAVEREACNAALKRLVSGRLNSNFINFRVVNALTDNRDNFADFIHYRPIVAEWMTKGIADSVKFGEAARIDLH